jgi:hypothetical protein
MLKYFGDDSINTSKAHYMAPTKDTEAQAARRIDRCKLRKISFAA